ncbi:hypothetical protein EX255_05740 [Staphylococcus epidermidis]|nr:hypothetical protein [Staphylococcus epidermidis]
MVEILVNTAIRVYIVALYTQWLSTRDNLKA